MPLLRHVNSKFLSHFYGTNKMYGILIENPQGLLRVVSLQDQPISEEEISLLLSLDSDNIYTPVKMTMEAQC